MLNKIKAINKQETGYNAVKMHRLLWKGKSNSSVEGAFAFGRVFNWLMPVGGEIIGTGVRV